MYLKEDASIPVCFVFFTGEISHHMDFNGVGQHECFISYFQKIFSSNSYQFWLAYLWRDSNFCRFCSPKSFLFPTSEVYINSICHKVWHRVHPRQNKTVAAFVAFSGKPSVRLKENFVIFLRIIGIWLLTWWCDWS